MLRGSVVLTMGSAGDVGWVVMVKSAALSCPPPPYGKPIPHPLCFVEYPGDSRIDRCDDSAWREMSTSGDPPSAIM